MTVDIGQVAGLNATTATYSASGANFSGVAGDNFVLSGSATQVVRVKRISISSSANTSQSIQFGIIKRSTADTGGTSTPVAATPHDSLRAPATATCLAYTAAPTPGTQVGSPLRSVQLFINTAGGTPGITEWNFGEDSDECPTLRGAGQQIALNFPSAPTNTPLIGFDIEWTESPT